MHLQEKAGIQSEPQKLTRLKLEKIESILFLKALSPQFIFLRMFVDKDLETLYYAIILFSKDDCSISSKSDLKCSLNPVRIDVLNLA